MSEKESVDNIGQVSFDNIIGSAGNPARKKRGRFRRWLIKRLSKDTVEIEDNTEFFIRSAQELIGNNTQDAFILETSRKLLVQQRIMDDTKARRRLEKWARNTILGYLITVFLLVVLNGLSQIYWQDIFPDHGFISDTVMTVILSTTTVNIIGLGVIVLRGHFPSYSTEEDLKNPQERKSENGK